MFDGDRIKLTYVRHVLELKEKIISLGVLDSCGHKFTCLRVCARS